ncbi:unnamed protein product [Lactuca saligna]|uniref:Uncharacterized protein n=1 Tax=Lactuca saligna TaxID=75948 RepID=A0AA36EPL9_LACSI|nr:unnamed protein product [Lactuca saligna]
MAGSSETTSFADQSASLMMLNVKPHQNLTLDIDSSRYPEALRPMIECLRFSPLAQALTMAESVPLVHLSKARLGFATTEGLVDLDLISSSALIEMFYQMGFIGDISFLSKFKKSILPPMWNGPFMLLFKSFSERVAGSTSAKISCARFWSVIVKRALTHFQVLVAEDSVIAVIPFLQTSSFETSDPTKFIFVGSILEAMLLNVPTDNVIMNEY